MNRMLTRRGLFSALAGAAAAVPMAIVGRRPIETGAWEIPPPGSWQLHPGETVFPCRFTNFHISAIAREMRRHFDLYPFLRPDS